MAPKPPPRAPKASPSFDFHRFLVDFGRFVDDFLHHVSYFLSGLRVGGIGRQASTIINVALKHFHTRLGIFSFIYTYTLD